MIYPNKPFYVISGFSPPSEYYMGGYGFHIGLKASFAKKCIKFKTEWDKIERMNERAGAVVLKIFQAKSVRPPFNFMDTEGNYTMMIHFVQVEGNACDMGTTDSIEQIMKMDDERMVEFHPHNVDSMTQSYMLLSLWLKWFDCAFAVVMDESEKKK